ncbi:hypothetical protein IGI04_027475, partial [Brassica rapa subsp. trilocularis]
HDQDLLVADLLSTETREWNVARIKDILPELSHLILKIKPSTLGGEDALIWPLNNTGEYTTKSALILSTTKRNLPPTGITINLLPWICWFLWISRNQLTFENRRSSPAALITKGLKAAQEWELAQSPTAPTLSKSHPPP